MGGKLSGENIGRLICGGNIYGGILGMRFGVNMCSSDLFALFGLAVSENLSDIRNGGKDELLGFEEYTHLSSITIAEYPRFHEFWARYSWYTSKKDAKL